MRINIEIDTQQDLDNYEKNILAALSGATYVPDAAEPAKPAPAKPADPWAADPWAEPKPAKPAPAKPAPSKPAPSKEPEPEEATEEVTMEEAVALASEMISKGKTAQVKAALTDLGVKRVSEMVATKQLIKFVAALKDL